MFKKILSLLRSTEKKTQHLHYYNLSQSCQIPRLHCLYEKYFGEINNGVFVEVGAFDGEYSSNSSCLADLGWNGFYIEPVPEYYKRCVRRHQQNKNTKVFNFAIGPRTDRVKINISGPLSTADAKTRDAFKNLSWSKNKITDDYVEVEQITLEDFLKKEDVIAGFELLVVDVEGYEWDVLKQFDIKAWSPEMVLIELHDQNPDYPHLKEKCKKIVEYFERANYRVVYKDFTNTVYVKRGIGANQ